MSLTREKYEKEVVPAIMEQFGIKNINCVPKIEKVCLNMGVGKAIEDSKMIDAARKDMATIAGQQPAVCQARIAVSNFKLREGYRIGCRATLRQKKMYSFLDRLLNVAIPRIRDFNGVRATSFDKQGNYSLGIEEVSIFPEVNADNSDYNFGMDVTFVIKNSTGPEMSRSFLKLLGVPFAENNK